MQINVSHSEVIRRLSGEPENSKCLSIHPEGQGKVKGRDVDLKLMLSAGAK